MKRLLLKTSKFYTLTDQELIEGCLKKDTTYEKALFLKYSGKMLTVCRRYTRHELEAEDILQDAFIKIFNNLKKFKFEGSFEGWIRRIVVNTALKNYKKSSFQKEQLGLEQRPEEPTQPTAYSRLGEEELLGLIQKLPEGYKIVFNLYAIEGFSHREIAETLQIQESTSRSQLVKARKMLQRLISELQKIRV